MYDEEGFQVANPINRFAIGDRDALKFAPDGSLTIYIQHTNPGGDKEANGFPPPPAASSASPCVCTPQDTSARRPLEPPAVRRATDPLAHAPLANNTHASYHRRST